MSSASASGGKSRDRKRKQPVPIAYEGDGEGEGVGENSDGRRQPPPPPPVANWLEQLANIRTMRAGATAPVDTMGCHILADKTADARTFRYQILVSLMLSSQTKDEVTSAAMARLRQHGCTIDNILATDDDQLGRLIYPVGFWKKKVDYIRRATLALRERHAGDIPDSVEGLCGLPGVGPKMAHITMRCAWDRLTGIGVDTHVHRIAGRLGWTRRAREPEDTRKQLEAWLPREHWAEVNQLLVGFGQQVCTPVNPRCSGCLNSQICPASSAKGAKQQQQQQRKKPQQKQKTAEPSA